MMVFIISTPDSDNANLAGISMISGVKDLVIYPNPLEGSIIRFNKKINFRLYDALGRTLAFKSNATEFDMSYSERGIYFIKTEDGEVVKLIRE
jgi:hypothetical protein